MPEFDFSDLLDKKEFDFSDLIAPDKKINTDWKTKPLVVAKPEPIPGPVGDDFVPLEDDMVGNAKRGYHSLREVTTTKESPNTIDDRGRSISPTGKVDKEATSLRKSVQQDRAQEILGTQTSTKTAISEREQVPDFNKLARVVARSAGGYMKKILTERLPEDKSNLPIEAILTGGETRGEALKSSYEASVGAILQNAKRVYDAGGAVKDDVLAFIKGTVAAVSPGMARATPETRVAATGKAGDTVKNLSRHAADIGLSTAGLGISLIPAVTGSGAVAGALTPLAKKIGNDIGGEEGAHVAETVTHYSTAGLVFGHRILLAMAASQAGSAGVDELLHTADWAKDIPDEDKMRLIEASSHASFFAALGGMHLYDNLMARGMPILAKKLERGEPLNPGERNIIRLMSEKELTRGLEEQARTTSLDVTKIQTGYGKEFKNANLEADIPQHIVDLSQKENVAAVEGSDGKLYYGKAHYMAADEMPPGIEIVTSGWVVKGAYRALEETGFGEAMKAMKLKNTTSIDEAKVIPDNLKDKVKYIDTKRDKNGNIQYHEYRITDESSPAFGADISLSKGENLADRVAAKERIFQKYKPLTGEQLRELKQAHDDIVAISLDKKGNVKADARPEDIARLEEIRGMLRDDAIARRPKVIGRERTVLEDTELAKLGDEYIQLKARTLKKDGKPRKNAKPEDIERLDEIRGLVDRHNREVTKREQKQLQLLSKKQLKDLSKEYAEIGNKSRVTSEDAKRRDQIAVQLRNHNQALRQARGIFSLRDTHDEPLFTRTAVRINGKVHVGEFGEIHPAIWERMALAGKLGAKWQKEAKEGIFLDSLDEQLVDALLKSTGIEDGFMTNDGKFVTRKEAAELVKQKRPDIAAKSSPWELGESYSLDSKGLLENDTDDPAYFALKSKPLFKAVALWIDGKLFEGVPGETHSDLMMRLWENKVVEQKEGTDYKYGFVTNEGKAISRQEATDLVTAETGKEFGWLGLHSPDAGIGVKKFKLEEDMLMKYVAGYKPRTLDVASIENIIAPLRTQFRGGELVEVVSSAHELPEGYQQYDNAMGVRIPYENGEVKIFIVADQHSTAKEVVQTFQEEVVGHHGLQGALGERHEPVMDQVWKAFEKEIKSSRNLRPYLELYDVNEPTHQQVLAEEYIVHLASKPIESLGLKDASLLRRIILQVKLYLNSKGINVGLSDKDIQTIIAKGNYHARGKGRETGYDSAVRYALKDKNEKTKWYYSQLTNHLEKALPGSAYATHVKGLVESWQKAGAYKQAELDAIGLNEWLDSKGTDRVTKEEVMDFVNSNSVAIDEVTYGNPVEIAPVKWTRSIGERGRIEYHTDELNAGVSMIYKSDGIRPWALEIVGETSYHRTLEEAKETHKAELKGLIAEPTKYQTYVMPGGEEGTYREMFLTLPNEVTHNMPVTATISKEDVNGVPMHEWLQKYVDNIDRNGEFINHGLGERMANEFARVYGSDPYNAGYIGDGPNEAVITHVDTKSYKLKENWDVVKVEQPYRHGTDLTVWELQYRGEPLGISAEPDGNLLQVTAPNAGKALEALIKRNEERDLDISQFYEEGEPIPKTWEDGHDLYQEVVNPLVRIRYNEHKLAEGEMALNIEELQPPSKDQQKKMPKYAVQNWREIAVKKILSLAGEKGIRTVTWTTGETQRQRYTLSKRVSAISYHANGSGLYRVNATGLRGGEIVINQGKMLNDQDLDRWFGKEMGDKIRTGVGESIPHSPYTLLKGVNLEIGGVGLKKLYDHDFPAIFEKLGKKYGVKTKQVITGTSDVALKPRYDLILRHANDETNETHWVIYDKTRREIADTQARWIEGNKSYREAINLWYEKSIEYDTRDHEYFIKGGEAVHSIDVPKELGDKKHALFALQANKEKPLFRSVAIRTADGTLYEGKPGEIHPQIWIHAAKAGKLDTEAQRKANGTSETWYDYIYAMGDRTDKWGVVEGFVTKDGKFLDRDQAHAYVVEQKPDNKLGLDYGESQDFKDEGVLPRFALKDTDEKKNWYYSQLEKHLNSSLPGKGTAADVASLLDKWQTAGAYKKGELDAVGVVDWLKEKGDQTVTKAEIIDYIQSNAVKVVDVELKGQKVQYDDEAWRTGDKKKEYRELFLTLPQAGSSVKKEMELQDDIEILQWKDVTKEKRKSLARDGYTAEDNDILPNHWVAISNTGNIPLTGYAVKTREQAIKQIKADLRDSETPLSVVFKAAEGTWRDGHGAYDDVENPLVRIRYDVLKTMDGNKSLIIDEIQPPHEDNQPDMPDFARKNWREIAVKKTFDIAAKKGLEFISWTTGKTQADRYNLEHHIKSLTYYKRPDGKVFVQEKPFYELFPENLTQEGLVNVLGKELGNKIFNTATNHRKTISGVDLNLGGEGLKRLYDQDLTSIYNKIGKKYGVEAFDIAIDDNSAPTRVGKWTLRPEYSFAVQNDRSGMGMDGTINIVDSRGRIVSGFPVVENMANQGAERQLQSRTLPERWNVMQINQEKLAKIATWSGNKPEKTGVTMHSIRVPEELRTKVLLEGQALFALKDKDKKPLFRAVALRTEKGKVFEGEPGDIHPVLYDRLLDEGKIGPMDELEDGFITIAGKFLDRNDTARHVDKHYPKNEFEYTGETGVLESLNLINKGDARFALKAKETGLDLDEQDRIRKVMKLNKLSEAEQRTWETVLEEAKRDGHDKTAMDVAEEALISRRPLLDVEHAGMVLKAAQLSNDYTVAIKEAATGNKQAKIRADLIMSQLDKLTDGARLARRESARALAIGRMMIENETFDLASVVQRAQANKGSALTPEEHQRLVVEVDKYADIEEQVKQAQEQFEQNREVTDREYAAKLVQQIAAEKESLLSGEGLLTERNELKKKLRTLGLRMHMAIPGGISPDVAYLVGKYAINVIKSGAKTLDDVVKVIQQDSPDLTKRDIYQAINARSPFARERAKTEAHKRVQTLKTQAKLIVDLENAEMGVFEPLKSRPTQPADIKEMQKKLRDLRANAYKTESVQMENAVQTINELQDMLDGHYRNVKARHTPDSAELTALRDKITLLKKIMKTEDEIASITEQLRTGEFIIKQPRNQGPVDPRLDRLQVELNMQRRHLRIAIDEAKPKDKFNETINLMRTLKATADMSATMRQGAFLSARRPVVAAAAFVKSAKAFFSEYTAEQIDAALRASELQYLRDKSGLYMASLGSGLNKAEEYFASNWAEKIPGFGKLVKASDRSMVTTLNILRTAAFDQFVESYPNATHAELTAWADYVNKASGRGDLGKFAQASKVASTVMFAPRFAVSRFQTPMTIVKYWNEPRVRKELAKDYAAFTALGMTALALASMAGVKVGTNPDDPDFGKMVIGNTRIDIWAGFQQPARLIARLAQPATLFKKPKDDNPLELVGRFAAFKLAPAITIPTELWRGKNIVNEKVTPTETMVNAVTPMVVSDIVDAYTKGTGTGNAVGVGAAGFVGLSTNTYGSKTAKSIEAARQYEELFRKNDYTEEQKEQIRQSHTMFNGIKTQENMYNKIKNAPDELKVAKQKLDDLINSYTPGNEDAIYNQQAVLDELMTPILDTMNTGKRQEYQPNE